MVFGRRLAVTSFLSVAGWLCFGSFSFCVLGARPFVLPLLLLSLVFVFFCVAVCLGVVGFAGFLLLLGFGLWRLLFAGRVADDVVCRLLLCWVCLFFGAFSFGWLLRFPFFYLFSPSALLLRGSAT